MSDTENKCELCGATGFPKTQVGKVCGKPLPHEKTCPGIISGTIGDDVIKIDGDKIIAFINGIKNLGMILDEVNFLGIKEPFLIGSQFQSVEKIIEQEKSWKKCLDHIYAGLKENLECIEANRQRLGQMVSMLKHNNELLTSHTCKEAMERLKQFSDLCDNIERHRKAGTLDIIAQIAKPQS